MLNTHPLPVDMLPSTLPTRKDDQYLSTFGLSAYSDEFVHEFWTCRPPIPVWPGKVVDMPPEQVDGMLPNL
jgi:hypothetical protein